jgi:hypothetical protein
MQLRLEGVDTAPAATIVPVPPCTELTMPGGAVTAPAAVQFLVPLIPAATMPGGVVIPLLERNDSGAQLDTALSSEDTRASLPLEPAISSDGGGPPLFHKSERGAELTMTTIDLLQVMIERLANGSSSGWAATNKYDWLELEYLFERVGTPRFNGSFTGLVA